MMNFSSQIRSSPVNNGMECSMLCKNEWSKILESVKLAADRHVLKKCSIFQLYYPDEDFFGIRCKSNEFPKRKLYHLNENNLSSVYEKEEILYPQVSLDKKCEQFLHSNYWFLTPQFFERVEECKLLYKEIVAVEKDDVKWFEALKEAKDHLFLCHNVEYRLGRNLENKALWKLYLGYLKECDHNLLLQTYSKYCRCPCFQDDGDMLREYEEMVNILSGKKLLGGAVDVPWQNPFDFERYDPLFFGEIQAVIKIRNNKHFSPSSATDQFFSLPTPMIKYVRENSPAEVLQKLYECCKIFYIRTPRANCHRLDICDSGRSLEIVGNTLKASGSRIGSTPKINVSKCFNVDAFNNLPLDEIIAKMDNFTAEIITIRRSVSLKQLEFFTHHGNVKYMHLALPHMTLDNRFIKAPIQYDFALEDVMALLPEIEKLLFFGISCTRSTSKKLLEMTFKKKIRYILIGRLATTDLDPVDFAKFVIKSCSPDAKVYMEWRAEIDTNYIKNFETVLQEATKAEWGEDTKIDIDVS